jgi:hypothetical protein
MIGLKSLDWISVLIRWAMRMDQSQQCNPVMVDRCGQRNQRLQGNTLSSGRAKPLLIMVSIQVIIIKTILTDWQPLIHVPGTMASYGLRKMIEPVINCRDISKRDMKHNNSLPQMTGKINQFFVPLLLLTEDHVE